MFRATMCPSSGENTVHMWHLVFVTLYRRLSGTKGRMKLQFHSALHTSHLYRVTNTSHRYGILSWWWAHSCPKHVEKRNKYVEKNCAPSWFYLQDCINWDKGNVSDDPDSNNDINNLFIYGISNDIEKVATVSAVYCLTPPEHWDHGFELPIGQRKRACVRACPSLLLCCCPV